MSLQLFRKFDLKISNFVYVLRNKNYVREYSLTSKKINYPNHLIWIKKFLNNPNNYFYIIRNRNVNIGYIRVERKKNNKILSWALIKKFQNKGIMKKNLLKITSNNKYTYKAVIKKKNLRSIFMATKVGFIKKKINKKIIYIK